MRFVPIGDIYISEWQTRRRDFEAFVQATGYDAVGGMSSAVTQNGFKLNEMSWKTPGFQQTPTIRWSASAGKTRTNSVRG